MQNLFLLSEYISNGYIPNILDIISIFAILCAIFVILSKNPIISILYLIGLFANISCYLILIGLSFIGLSYLIVYVGAVSILFLFILMLINIRTSELQSNTSNSMILSFIIIVSFNYLLFQIIPYNIAISNNSIYYINNILYNIHLNKYVKNTNIDNENLFYVTSNMWDGNIVYYNHITSIGNIMYTNYNIWLYISSLILLLAMIGAIVITIKQK